jgi:multiple sugar transport system ATP-binding protein
MTPPAAIGLDAIAKRFGRVDALQEVSFDVPLGGLTVLLGPTGAGKTTTLRLVAGLESPDRGRVLLAGRDMRDVEPRHRDVGMVFDTLALYPDRSIFDNIAAPLLIARRAPEQIRWRVEQIADLLHIRHTLARLPRTLSGGERQRAALGRVMARDPGVYLLDEPLSSLDALLRVELRGELRRLQRETGRTFLVATPDYAEALAMADTIVVLLHGRVAQIGSPRDIYERPATVDVARLVGNPPINLLPARVTDDAGRPVVAIGPMRLPIAAEQHARWSGSAQTGALQLGVRPEDVDLGATDGADAVASVVDIEPLGLESTVELDVGGLALRASVAPERCRGLARGHPVGVRIALQHALAFDAASGVRR